MKWVQEGEIQKFIEYVRENIGKKINNSQSNDITEKMKQLDELKNQGLITKTEFQDKRKELLAKL